MKKLLLAFKDGEMGAQHQAKIRQLAPHLDLVQTIDEAKIAAMIEEIEIAVGQFPPQLLAKAKNLRWFQQWSAGADWLLDHPEVQTMDFVLTSASGVHAIPISEHIFAFLLAFARNLPQAWHAQQERVWMKEQNQERRKTAKEDIATYSRRDMVELAGKTMLLIGIGEIGERTAQIARALEMGIIGVRNNPDHDTPGVSQMVGPDELVSVLPKADVIISTVPLTAETHHMLNQAAFDAMKQGAYLINIGRGGTVDQEALDAMKRGAYFINIGRGGTVDQEALITALRSGTLAGAGLDVFEEEPLPADSPLWAMDNVLLTPHASGATPQYNERAFAIFLDNLQRYQAGAELRNVVDKSKGY